MITLLLSVFPGWRSIDLEFSESLGRSYDRDVIAA